MGLRSIFIFAIAMLFFTAEATAEGWQVYVNARYATRAEVPADFVAEPLPENGDGQRFSDPKGSGTISIYGGMNATGGTLDDYRTFLKEILEGEGWHLSYVPQGRNWFVLSGTREGEMIYQRVEHAPGCSADMLHHIAFRYLASEGTKWGQIVRRGATTLDGPCG
ncbi:MAG TPA: hypothetical protein DIC56_06850 [Rhizobium sp.]|nr:hypothetical protein [Rhizobium sp.]